MEVFTARFAQDAEGAELILFFWFALERRANQKQPALRALRNYWWYKAIYIYLQEDPAYKNY